MNQIYRVIGTLLLTASLLAGCATQQVKRTTEEHYAEAQRLFDTGRYEAAIVEWKEVKDSYKSAELSAKAELAIADAYFKNRDYIEAAASYDTFLKFHPKHEKAEYALYQQATSHFKQIGGIDTDQTPVKNTRIIFESYLRSYPSGEHAAEAKEKISECIDKEAQYELYVADFYINNKQYSAAITRLENVLTSFPKMSQRDEVLFLLGTTYIKNGQKEKGEQVLQTLIKDFPNSPFAIKAKN